MSGAYDCNYDFVDDPKQALVEAHEEIRELESQHAAEIARLRLADAEREALSEVVDCLTETGTALVNATTTRNTLAALLARLA